MAKDGTNRGGRRVRAGAKPEPLRETWAWLDARGCSQFVAPRLIESYAQAFARYVQCEQAISKFGLLGKPPPPVPPSRPRSSPCRSRLVSRRMCTGTRFTRSSAPPARPTIRVRRLRIS